MEGEGGVSPNWNKNQQIVSDILDSRHASIFEISIFSDRKVNVIGTFGRSTLKILSDFGKLREKQNKRERKMIIFTQNRFSTHVLILGVTQKLITVDH